ncbi:MAG: hypothetical protein [Caudoviricetes sp.]|nr:MAG: hypothetical protein [Caudoviricetes sp.]
MKILSLQSVGLGAVFPSGDYLGINEPYIVKVGEKIKDGRGYETQVDVTRIEDEDEWYKVYTSDGHFRIFPADKYISEWSE